MRPDLADAHPVLRERVETLRARYADEHPGHTLELTCVYRSPAEQFELYKKGRTQVADGLWTVTSPGQKVTNCDGTLKPSKHNVRPARAVDVVVVLSGKWLWAETEYEPLGALALAVGLVWGGSWRPWRDLPHLELPVAVT